MHESLDEFKFRADTTTDSRVICPCTFEKFMYNVVNTLAPTSRTSSKFGQTEPRTAELAALERLEKSP